MPLAPKIKPEFDRKTCPRCGREKNSFAFTRSKSPFFVDGYCHLCNDCITDILREGAFEWDIVDRVCQYADVPFNPEKWEAIYSTTIDEEVFPVYVDMFFTEEYEGIGWSEYNEAYKELKENGAMSEAIPTLQAAERQELQTKWGFNYDDEALHYLEDLYDGLRLTQNINGKLQDDQAQKICKISYEIDCRIREGVDFDKLLTSYDKLVKSGEFTPKNVKNASDFESVGELCRWLEKKGFVNGFYDGATRDVVDETIKNIQSWNQRLYINESGIGYEITQRIRALQSAAELERESYYNIDPDVDDYDNYENEGFKELFSEDDEFKVDLE